jgi:ATP-dependent helicase HepA
MAEDLVVGCLVRWVRGEAIGVVSVLTGNRVEVAWDDPELPPFFARDGAPLERFELPVRVRRRSTDEPGFNVGPVPGAATPSRKVAFALSGTERVVPESDLRPDDALDPADRLANGVTPGSAKQVNITTATRHYLLEHRHNALVCLDAARVDVKPHQVGVVHRVVTNYPHRFLLCDEVGLGKTIEAAMVIKELRARGEAQRTLIIVPPNLLRQWQFELKSKFNETFSILNADTTRALSLQGVKGNPFAAVDSVLVSESWASDNKQSEQILRATWDLVIVDEAHHARSKRSGNKVSTTKLYKLVRELTDRSLYPDRAALFLTATPMQLESHELYSLVEMLDPALFPTEEVFDQHRSQVRGLSRLVESLQSEPPPDRERLAELVEDVATWLEIDPADAASRLIDDDPSVVAAELSDRHLLSEILIRNRKAKVGGFMPRRAHRWEVVLTDAEREALGRVEDYVAEGFAAMSETKDHSIGFLMVAYQKMMASSIAALRTSLALRRDRLGAGSATSRKGFGGGEDSEIDDDVDDVSESAAGAGTVNAREVAQLDELVGLLDALPIDSKAAVFATQMDVLKEEAEVPKVLVFTQFRATQDHLAGLLRERGWTVSLFHGQMSSFQKDAAVDAFRDDDAPHVLISTEAGGEGRNFQFCHLLVNYDLPWNPMRVEQRIGRVDRIGQDRIVEIFNLWVKDSVEERVLDVLEQRINLFVETVGGLDPILGETERDIREIMRRNRGERDDALADLGRRLQDQVAAARSAEEKLADLIMDTKSLSREIVERISGESSPVDADDQERFMTHLLGAVRTHVQRAQGEWNLHFHDPFRAEHAELFQDGPKRRAVFRADEHRDAEYVEYLAFGHQIVDAAAERVLEPAFPGAAGGRRVFASPGLDPGAGWLFVWLVTVPDLRERRVEVPLYVSDNGEMSEEVGQALVQRSLAFGDEQSIPDADLPLDSLSSARDGAEQHVAERTRALEEEARARLLPAIERERSKLTTYFEYRERVAYERLNATSATLDRLRSSPEAGDQRILPVWQARYDSDTRLLKELDDERHRRMADLERRAGLGGDHELVQVVRVEVMDMAEGTT